MPHWVINVMFSGEILLKSAVNREKEKAFKFQVTAFDGYYYTHPAATVDVTITDINDNPPVFDSTYTFTIAGIINCRQFYVGVMLLC